jgi:glycosyltransferase involved in cell wall biosynthesis
MHKTTGFSVDSGDTVLFVAPFTYSGDSPWYSPGRFQKILQVETLLCSLSFSIFRINTAPDVITDTQFPHLQLTTLTHPLPRLIHSIASIFIFLLRRPFRSKVAGLWVYNTRLSEVLIALCILLFFPSITLYLQVEDLPGARKQNAGLRGFLDLLALYILIPRSNHIFVVSHVVGQSLHTLLRRNLRNLSVLPPYLSIGFLNSVKQRSLPFSRPTTTILYAGGYGEEKGVRQLIDAFSRLHSSDFVLQLVGSVPDSVASPLRSHHCIHLVGQVSNTHLYQLYSQADIVVCPHTVWKLSSYLFPFKLIEYAASGALPFFTRMPGVEVLGLPSVCFFDTVEQLTVKLIESDLIWNQHRYSLLASAQNLRERFSFHSAQSSMAALFNRTTSHVDV